MLGESLYSVLNVLVLHFAGDFNSNPCCFTKTPHLIITVGEKNTHIHILQIFKNVFTTIDKLNSNIKLNFMLEKFLDAKRVINYLGTFLPTVIPVCLRCFSTQSC